MLVTITIKNYWLFGSNITDGSAVLTYTLAIVTKRKVKKSL